MRILFFIFIFVLFFNGCSDTKSAPPFLHKLSDDGVASLNTQTPFTENKIAPHLLGYDLTLFSAFLAGKSQKIIRVSYKGQDVMLLTASQEPEAHIQSIIIISDFIENPLNLKLHEILDEKKFSTCREENHLFACKNNKYKNITANYMKNSQDIYKLQEIVWSENAPF